MLVLSIQNWAPVIENGRYGGIIGQVRRLDPVKARRVERLQHPFGDKSREVESVKLCQSDADLEIPDTSSEFDKLVLDMEEQASIDISCVNSVCMARFLNGCYVPSIEWGLTITQQPVSFRGEQKPDNRTGQPKDRNMID